MTSAATPRSTKSCAAARRAPLRWRASPTAIVVAIYFAILFPRLPAARGRAVSAAAAPRGVAARLARRRRRRRTPLGARRRASSSLLLVAMMVFTGLQWAAMPPSRVETIDPRTPSHLRRVRRKQSRNERRARRQGDRAPRRPAVFVRAAMHRRSRRNARHVPRARARTSSTASSSARPTRTSMLVPGFVATFTTTFPARPAST